MLSEEQLLDEICRKAGLLVSVEKGQTVIRGHVEHIAANFWKWATKTAAVVDGLRLLEREYRTVQKLLEANTTARVRPFSSGTEYMDWERNNCGRCNIDSDTCPYAFDMMLATVGDGTITRATAEVIGCANGELFAGRCNKREPSHAD